MGFYKFACVTLGLLSVVNSSVIKRDIDLDLSPSRGECSQRNGPNRKEWFVLSNCDIKGFV